jgi:hypothetical protein
VALLGIAVLVVAGIISAVVPGRESSPDEELVEESIAGGVPLDDYVTVD